MDLNIKETNLNFNSLTKRDKTDMIVIHHTGVRDIDASAEDIHGWHLNQGWAGIGYHFVIRKDGTIERGRPEWAVGSHAYGENSHSIGIHLSGDFSTAVPTAAQVKSCINLIADICGRYGIPNDRDHVVGHGELMPTDCPGANLQALLDSETLTGGAPKSDYGAKEKRIWDFLKGKGLTDIAAAGVMGNLYAESGLSPTNLENYYESKLGMSDAEYTAAVDDGSYGNFVYDKAGYGLAQWTYWSRKKGLLDKAKSAGVSIGDLNLQLDFLWQEMYGLLGRLNDAATVQDASNIMLFEFERPADQSASVQKKRASFGEGFFRDYAGEEEPMIYNTIEEVPDYAKPTIQKLIDHGSLKGSDGGLNLPHESMRIYVTLDREGVIK